jgi:LysR family glycine cleavage system transcriptional activator
MSRPPLHALQGFVTAARYGNVSRAAEAMHLTVSALSHQIKALEQRLGYAVFVRGSRGITLTGDGEHLLGKVSPHLEAIEQALKPYSARRDQVLTLSIIPSLASSWLIPRLASFLARHPSLEFSLRSSAELVDFVREPEVDAAIRSGNGHWAGLKAEHLFDEALLPVASPALIKRMRATLGAPSKANLHRWPLIGESSERWKHWFSHFGNKQPARFIAHFDDPDAIQRAAVEGVGVALARETRVQRLIHAGALVALLPAIMHADYAHYLVYPSRSFSHPGLLAFRSWLLAEARAYASELKLSTSASKPRRAGAPR